MKSESLKSVFICALSYVLWGLLPVFWKLLKPVPAFEVLCNRTFWSLIFLCVIIWLTTGIKGSLSKLANYQAIRSALIASLFLSANWLTYIWAVANGYVLECSLGYFITPLLNIMIGYLLLGEKINRIKSVSALLAIASVVNLVVNYGKFPFIAISLAVSFAIYGYYKKKSPLDSLEGLFAETLVLLPFTIMGYWYFYLSYGSQLTDPATTSWIKFLLILSGPVTAVPLLLFAKGAKEIRMSTVGVLQYISPTIQFLLAVFVFKEAFSVVQLVSFIMIWISICIYVAGDMFASELSAINFRRN